MGLILLPVFVEDVASGDRAARPSIAPTSDFAFMAHTPFHHAADSPPPPLLRLRMEFFAERAFGAAIRLAG